MLFFTFPYSIGGVSLRFNEGPYFVAFQLFQAALHLHLLSITAYFVATLMDFQREATRECL